jgi:hypothetical protein
MATYVNNLRLTELATGEGSGTWGTTTNTNLELIGQALGFGTRAIANASTDNITIADGASDADRAMYLKLTGGGQACTVTILPNTTSKVWWMENATSYTLTFTCGSGANVAVLAGETKCISTDGLGSGGAVYDVLTDVNLAGTTKVDDLVVGDALTVGGTLGVTGVLTATSLDISGDVDIDGTTNLDVVDIDGAVDMASTLAVGGVVTANAGVVVDNFTLDGTTLALSSGDLTLDVAGDIILDADGGDIFFKNGGIAHGNFLLSGTDFTIGSSQNNGDLIFRGIDGGADITALTLDMSEAGEATFNGDIRLNDSKAARFGTDQDFRISFDGTGAVLQNVTSDSDITFLGNDGGSTITALTLDMSAAGAATFNAGMTVGGNVTIQKDDALIFMKETDGTNIAAVGDLTGAGQGGAFYYNHGGTAVIKLNSYEASQINTGMIFNEDAADLDFRVESSGNANMLFVDGGANHVNIGTATDLAGVLNVDGNISLSGAGTGGRSILLGGETGSYAGVLRIQAGGISAAFGGGIALYGHSHASKPGDVVLGISQDSGGSFRVNSDGVDTGTDRLEVTETGAFTTTPAAGNHAVFNEGGIDANFRVESDTNANMLFVDAGNSHVGMGTATLNRSGLGADHIVLTVGADTEMGMLELQGTRTSDADLGRISFLNAGTRRAEIVAARIDADNSTKLYFQTSNAGSLGTRLTIGKDGAATFNSSVLGSIINAGVSSSVGIGTATADANVAELGSGYLNLGRDDTADAAQIAFSKNGVLHSSIVTDNNDLRIKGNTSNLGIRFDGSDNGSNITALRLDISAAGAATFNSSVVVNESGADANFRVESDTNANALIVDAGLSHVGINRAANSVVALSINSTATNSSTYALEACDSSSATKFHVRSDGHSVFYKTGNAFGFVHNTDGGITTTPDAGGHAVFNEGGVDADFRVESDTNTHALFVDAGNSYVNLNSSATPDASVAGFMFTADQLYTSAGAATTLNYQVRFYNGNGLVGSITTDGSATAYLTSSDQRLKENIADADDAGSKIDAIQVRKFDWKVDGSHQDYGMVAQELQLVAPEAVSGDADSEEMMGVDYSKLVPMMLKEIQSLRARVADLES